MGWEYILIFLNGYLLVKMVMGFANMMSGYCELKKMPYLLNAGIKVDNTLYNKRRYVCQMYASILAIILCCCCLIYIKDILSYSRLSGESRALYSRYIIVFIFCLASSIIELVMSVFRNRFGRECYLTKDGMLTIEGIYRKERFGFAVEAEVSEAGRGNKYIIVYKNKAGIPYRYKVIEKEDAVIEMINGFKN